MGRNPLPVNRPPEGDAFLYWPGCLWKNRPMSMDEPAYFFTRGFSGSRCSYSGGHRVGYGSGLIGCRGSRSFVSSGRRGLAELVVREPGVDRAGIEAVVDNMVAGFGVAGDRAGIERWRWKSQPRVRSGLG